jgi:hypothetical protein
MRLVGGAIPFLMRLPKSFGRAPSYPSEALEKGVGTVACRVTSITRFCGLLASFRRRIRRLRGLLRKPVNSIGNLQRSIQSLVVA